MGELESKGEVWGGEVESQTSEVEEDNVSHKVHLCLALYHGHYLFFCMKGWKYWGTSD